MWDGAVKDGTIKKIISLMDAQPQGVLGVSACSDDAQWRYYIAVSSSADIDDSLEEYIIRKVCGQFFPRRDGEVHPGIRETHCNRVASHFWL